MVNQQASGTQPNSNGKSATGIYGAGNQTSNGSTVGSQHDASKITNSSKGEIMINQIEGNGFKV